MSDAERLFDDCLEETVVRRTESHKHQQDWSDCQRRLTQAITDLNDAWWRNERDWDLSRRADESVKDLVPRFLRLGAALVGFDGVAARLRKITTVGTPRAVAATIYLAAIDGDEQELGRLLRKYCPTPQPVPDDCPCDLSTRKQLAVLLRGELIEELAPPCPNCFGPRSLFDGDRWCHSCTTPSSLSSTYQCIENKAEWPAGWNKLGQRPPETVDGLAEYLRITLHEFRRTAEIPDNYEFSDKPAPDSIFARRSGQPFWLCQAEGMPRVKMKGPSCDHAVATYRDQNGLPVEAEVDVEPGVFQHPPSIPGLVTKRLSLRAIYNQMTLAAVRLRNANVWLDERLIDPSRPQLPEWPDVPSELLSAVNTGTQWNDLALEAAEAIEQWHKSELPKAERTLQELLVWLSNIQSVIPKADKALPIVNLPCRTVTVETENYDVDSVQALRWLKVLVEHPGEWIASEELKGHDKELDGVCTDKLKKHLPDAIRGLIESCTGKGSRIKL